jgi:hypothetical protein
VGSRASLDAVEKIKSLALAWNSNPGRPDRCPFIHRLSYSNLAHTAPLHSNRRPIVACMCDPGVCSGYTHHNTNKSC